MLHLQRMLPNLHDNLAYLTGRCRSRTFASVAHAIQMLYIYAQCVCPIETPLSVTAHTVSALLVLTPAHA